MFAKLGTRGHGGRDDGLACFPGSTQDAIKQSRAASSRRVARSTVLTEDQGARLAEHRRRHRGARSKAPKGKASLWTPIAVLVTVGRFPNTEGHGPRRGGHRQARWPFHPGRRAAPHVAAEHVFAIGDVACQPMLAHKATYEGELVAEIIARPQPGLRCAHGAGRGVHRS